MRIISFAFSMLLLMVALLPAGAQGQLSYTLLTGNLCGATMEHRGLPPFVIVGNIIGNECAWQFTLADGKEDRRYVLGAGEHDFRAEIGEAYASIFVDGKEFRIPRAGAL